MKYMSSSQYPNSAAPLGRRLFGKAMLTVLGFLVGTQCARAADIVWTNAAGGNWSTPANWSPNQVPGAADNAYITNNGTYTVTVNANASPGTVTIGGTSGTQTLNLSAGTFTLNGLGSGNAQSALTISGGTLAGSGDGNDRRGAELDGGDNERRGQDGHCQHGQPESEQRHALLEQGPAERRHGHLDGRRTERSTAARSTTTAAFTANSSGTLNCSRRRRGQRLQQRRHVHPARHRADHLCSYNTGVSFNNSGTVVVQAGTLGADAGGTQQRPLHRGRGATLRLNGTHTFGADADITGPGGVSVPGGTTHASTARLPARLPWASAGARSTATGRWPSPPAPCLQARWRAAAW